MLKKAAKTVAKKSVHTAKKVSQKSLNTARAVSDKLPIIPSPTSSLPRYDEVLAAREYIAGYWKNLERYHPKDDESLLGLPNKYLVPSYDPTASFDYNEMYYWDSYFMVQGLLDEQHKELVIGILENLFSLFERFRCIPNATRTYLTGRSQPPFLTSFIFDVYNTYGMDKDWLTRAIEIAKQEYRTVWMGERKPNERLVHRGLSRYYDINHLHDLAEAESGWDMTTRFNRHALNYLPVDLNALLYKYEADFAHAARLLGNIDEADKWDEVAATRARTMQKTMWNKVRGMYFDYNYVKDRNSSVSSLATYFPMWAGMVSVKQAEQLVKNLRKFEQKGGLAATDNLPIGQMMPGALPVQWAHPNGWAPLHFIVVKGLVRYGYHKDAERIAAKWLHGNLSWYNEHGVFLEKYNVVNPAKPPQKGVYPSQTGFGWTNGVFESFCRQFVDRSPGS